MKLDIGSGWGDGDLCGWGDEGDGNGHGNQIAGDHGEGYGDGEGYGIGDGDGDGFGDGEDYGIGVGPSLGNGPLRWSMLVAPDDVIGQVLLATWRCA